MTIFKIPLRGNAGQIVPLNSQPIFKNCSTSIPPDIFALSGKDLESLTDSSNLFERGISPFDSKILSLINFVREFALKVDFLLDLIFSLKIMVIRIYVYEWL